MDDYIFIPSISVQRQRRSPGGKPFWDNFWKSFRAPDQYETRRLQLRDEVQPLLQTTLPQEANLYAEVEYTDGVTAKSNRPSRIWSDSHLEVVESTEKHKFTVSGKKEDFERLNAIIEASSFSNAKGGTNVRPGDKTTSREVYAVAAIRNKNLGLEGRIDKPISDLVNLNAPDEIECIIELYQDRLGTEYDEIYRLLSIELHDGTFTPNSTKVTKRDRHALFNNMTYYAKLTVAEIRHLLEENETFNFIRLIRTAPNFSAQRSLLNIDMSGITIDPVQTNEIVGVFDSGITSPLMHRLRHNHEKFIKTHRDENTEHGTLVCSRVLFGEDIEKVITREIDHLTPVAKYLDVQVLYYDPNEDKTNSDDDELLKALDEVTSRYPDIKVFNFSVADTTPLDEKHPSELTERMDQLARERDVLFICVTGNNEVYRMVEYDELFSRFSNSTMLLAPGDTVGNLTIGSSATNVDDDSSAEVENSPSPFTRAGVIRGDVRKPDLVANGGNYLKPSVIENLPSPDYALTTSLQRYGVAGISESNTPRRDFGTSLSAPLITRESIIALDWLKRANIGTRLDCAGNYANLVKALVVHSTSETPLPSIDDPAVRAAYGYGIPSVGKIMHSSEDRVTILYCDELDGNTKKHKLLFELPEFVTSSDLEFTFTLAYTPPVDRNFEEYSMINVDGTVRVPYPAIEDGEEVTKYKPLNPDSTWTNGKNKMSGISHFRKKKSGGIATSNLEVLVQMYTFKEYDEKFSNKEEIKQKYSFALTIKDLSGNGRLRQELMQSSQIETLAPIEVEVSVPQSS